MNLNKVLKDIALAFLSQGISTLSSIVLSLVLPKLLGVREYGYWQLLIFYMSYAGFMHFGLNDGLYLEKGGQTRRKIDKKSVNSQFMVSLLFQGIIAIGVFIFALVGPFEEERAFVLTIFSVTFLLANASTLLGFVFQAMNETPLFSLSCVIETISLFTFFIALMVTGINVVEPYLVAYLISKIFRLGYCIFHAMDFIKAGIYAPKECLTLSLHSINIGIKLMISNIMSQLILGCVRFFIDANWGIEVFSIVSFSISIASLFLTFLSQVSMVFFPNLKQASDASLKKIFVVMRDGLDMMLPCIYILFGPIVVILNAWVPQYAKSLELFSILFPICVFDGKMDIVGTTFFKVLRKEKCLLKINMTAFIASALITIMGTYVFHSVEFTLTGVMLILGARSTYSELKISKFLNAEANYLGFMTLALSLAFVFIAQVAEPLPASLIFCSIYLAYLTINKNTLHTILTTVKALKKSSQQASH